MNARERVLKALRREGLTDRIPFEISWGAFTPLLMKTFREKTGSELSPEEYFDFDTRFVLPGPTRLTTDFSAYFTELEADVSFSEWGVGSVPTWFEIPDYKYHPLETMESVDQVNRFAWPDLGEDYRYVDVAAKVEAYHRRGYVPAKDEAGVTESGNPTGKVKGVKFLRMESDAAVYEVGSGCYQFCREK